MQWSEIADGSKELRDGVRELQEEADDMIEEYFTFDIDNLTQFLVAGGQSQYRCRQRGCGHQ